MFFKKKENFESLHGPETMSHFKTMEFFCFWKVFCLRVQITPEGSQRSQKRRISVKITFLKTKKF